MVQITVGTLLGALGRSPSLPRDFDRDARRGTLRWRRGDLRCELRVWRGSDEVGVVLFVKDGGKLGDDESSGGISLHVPLTPDPAWKETPSWPEGKSDLSSIAEEFLYPFLASATDLITDRRDLCRVLMEPRGVTRGGVRTAYLVSSYPARLVQALLLARDLECQDLEDEIQVILGSAQTWTIAPGVDENVGVAARRWAATYAKVLKTSIAPLA